MSSSTQETVYYCNQCRIETSFATVCPKCHRKGTLVPRNQMTGTGTGGARRRVSSSALAAVGPGATSRRWLLAGGIGLVGLAGLGLVLWFALRDRAPKTPPKTEKTPERSFATGSPESATPGASRVFGARPPGTRIAPPPPPKRCGTAYRTRIHFQFKTPADTGGKRPPKKGTAPKKSPKKNHPKKNHPDAVTQTHTFLITTNGSRVRYLPLDFQTQIVMGGRTVTAFQIGRSGAMIPNPRTRRLDRKGYHDTLKPGLRISDLIDRAQADLGPDPGGGLRVLRQHLKNPLVNNWLLFSVGLANFLTPRSPKPQARSFTDTRLPPGQILRGVTALIRRFTLKKSNDSEAAKGEVTFAIDAPRGLMRKAKTAIGASGEVVMTPGAPWPTKARLILTGIPRKGGGDTTVTMALERLGPQCNQ